jgi:drug/metabolite transporter (DMT)-like permease
LWDAEVRAVLGDEVFDEQRNVLFPLTQRRKSDGNDIDAIEEVLAKRAALRGVVQVAAKAGLALWPSPFAASLIGYSVSSATVLAVSRLARHERSPVARSALLWFMATGLLNGGAVVLMYLALSVAPVSLVAPVVAGYPLVTVVLGSALLREERLTVRMVSGALLIVAAIAYLVAA